MVIPMLFRNKNKDYLIDHSVIWCKLVHNKLEPENRMSKAEIENMLYNQGWERDINTPITIHGARSSLTESYFFLYVIFVDSYALIRYLAWIA
jgi:hypothetical protein